MGIFGPPPNTEGDRQIAKAPNPPPPTMTNPEATDNPNIPERYREPKFVIFEEVMPASWLAELGQWLHSQRVYFQRGGDDGTGRYNYEMPGVDEIYAPLAELKKAITGCISEAVKATGVDNFDLENIECNATLHHHGSHASWHAGTTDDPPTRRLAFSLYLHADPIMFSGGEIEFADGTTVDAKNNRLVIYEPSQQYRIRRVECWSAEFLHGRWAISGWIHGGLLK